MRKPDTRRCLVTTGVGAAVALAWVMLPKIDQSRCGDLGLGCPSLDLVVVPAGLLLAAMVTWGVLAAAGINRAWLVALLLPFPVFTLVKLVLDQTTELTSRAVAPLFVVAVTIGYLIAAVLSDDGLPRVRRVAAAVPVVVLFGCVMFWP